MLQSFRFLGTGQAEKSNLAWKCGSEQEMVICLEHFDLQNCQVWAITTSKTTGERNVSIRTLSS
jgi:hypothetical protein